MQEILAEILGVGTASKSVSAEYERLTSKFGSELSILREVPVDELKRSSTLLGEAVSRLRTGKVIKQAGYDGEYGIIRLFEDGELVKKKVCKPKA